MDNVSQTQSSFHHKWDSSHDYQIEGSDSFDSDTLNWIVTRNGFNSLEDLVSHVSTFRNVLDAGCGNGRILRLFADFLKKGQSLYGLDFASAEIARKNLGALVTGVFTADLMDLDSLQTIPKPDFIYCQEVLHHTSEPSIAFANLANILSPGGEIAIYVYKEKAPIREYTDDYVRTKIESMTPEEAMVLTNDFALFGRALSDLNLEVETPALRLLGIPAGTYQIQRLFYHFFLKCYWNSELTEEQNNMVNFDWYHPSICSRHSLEEVLTWFSQNGLEVIHHLVDDYGITVRGLKVEQPST